MRQKQKFVIKLGLNLKFEIFYDKKKRVQHRIEIKVKVKIFFRVLGSQCSCDFLRR